MICAAAIEIEPQLQKCLCHHLGTFCPQESRENLKNKEKLLDEIIDAYV
jgi:hypothetical protein